MEYSPARFESSSVNQAAPPLADFAVVLAHRIRNLVAGIEGFIGLLADTLGTHEQRELALRILESTTRIEFVLNDLQRYSQPLDIWMLPVTTNDLMYRLERLLDESQAQRITIQIAEEARQNLLVDAPLLEQALLIVIQNAFEASSPEDTIRLELTQAQEPEPSVVFHVWNVGRIDIKGAEDRIFEPFYTTKANNLGLGLSIARRIAEAHDGTLRLTTNTEDEGTCLSLSLPIPESSTLFEEHRYTYTA